MTQMDQLTKRVGHFYQIILTGEFCRYDWCNQALQLPNHECGTPATRSFSICRQFPEVLYQDLTYYQDNDNPDHNQDKPSNKHRNQRIASRGFTRPESTSNIIRGNDDRFGMLFKIRHITISLLEFGGKFSFVGSESGLQGSMITGPVGLRRLIRQQTDRDGPGRSMMIGKGDAPTGTPSAEYDPPIS
jgi:hypothetical protein